MSSSTPAAAAPSGGGGIKVQITAGRFVALWRWNVADPDDVCGICRLDFEACCPSCTMPGDDCPPMIGGCHHAFHMHCILAWLHSPSFANSVPVCPLCRQPWALG